MNWFIYIGGFFPFCALFHLIPWKDDSKSAFAWRCVPILMMWIWICWKFIK